MSDAPTDGPGGSAPPPEPEQPQGGLPPQPIEPTAPSPQNAAAKSWIAAGIVTAVVAIGVVIAISVSGHKSKSNASANGAPSSEQGVTAGRFRGRGAAGTITAINGTSFTLERRQATGASGQSAGSSATPTTVTVDTSSSTVYTASVTGALSDLKVGDRILVTGPAGNGTVAATRVVDNGDQRPGGGAGPSGASGFSGRRSNGPSGASGFSGRGFGASGPSGQAFSGGTITAINGSTITLQTGAGATETVTTSNDTTYTVTKPISFSDLKTGDTVAVTGTTSGSTITATQVRKGDLTTGGFGVGGGGFGGGPGQDAPGPGGTAPAGVGGGA